MLFVTLDVPCSFVHRVQKSFATHYSPPSPGGEGGRSLSFVSWLLSNFVAQVSVMTDWGGGVCF